MSTWRWEKENMGRGWFLAWAVPALAAAFPAAGAEDFRRGDINGDGSLDIADPVRLLSDLFGGFDLPCEDAADVDDSGTIDLSDGLRVLGYLFQGGAAPAPPWPGCGIDPTDDSLGCGVHSPCDLAQETFRFKDGFENADSLVDLVGLDRWHNVQIEPSTNRVEVTSEKVHSGTRALKLVAASGSGRTTKADIDRQLLTFKKGDEVYFSGWFYLVGGRDVTGIFLWDLESTQYYNAPGRRLYIQGGEYLASDLGKWLPEPPRFRQSSGT